MRKYTYIRKLALSIVALFAVSMLTSACGNNIAEAEAEYEATLIETVALIRLYAEVSEMVLGHVASTWRNAIDDRRDFNESLRFLFSLDSMQDLLDSLRENNAIIVENMRDLQDPPERLRDAYDALLDLFEIYSQLHSLAVSPSGSLQSFNAARNDLSARFSATYARLEVLLP